MWTVLFKDLRIELRTGEMLSSLFLLSLLILLTLTFALEPERLQGPDVVSGLLWAGLVLAGTISLSRSFHLEREAGGWTGLALSPIDRGAIYLGKVAANFLFLMTAAILMLPLILLLLGDKGIGAFPQALPGVALVSLLGTLGIAAVGTLFSAMTIRARAREVLLPLLLFPLLAPLVIAAARSTAGILGGDSIADSGNWIGLLGIFDALFLAAGGLTFDFVMDE